MEAGVRRLQGAGPPVPQSELPGDAEDQRGHLSSSRALQSAQEPVRDAELQPV